MTKDRANELAEILATRGEERCIDAMLADGLNYQDILGYFQAIDYFPSINATNYLWDKVKGD